MRTKIGEKYYELPLGQAHSLLALFDTLRPEDRHMFEATAMKRFGVDLESCETDPPVDQAPEAVSEGG